MHRFCLNGKNDYKIAGVYISNWIEWHGPRSSHRVSGPRCHGENLHILKIGIRTYRGTTIFFATVGMVYLEKIKFIRKKNFKE